MNKVAIINHLISVYGYQTYLEIGVDGGHTFRSVCIACQNKTGVDPVGGDGVLPVTSDEFFRSNQRQYDIIFIDGLHHSDQVLRDVCSSLEILTPNGTIVCHDVSPNSFEEQVVPRQQTEWTGDCWRAWVRLRMERADLEMHVVDTDYGCGIIRKGAQTLLPRRDQFTYDTFRAQRYQWLNLISVAEFRTRHTPRAWAQKEIVLSEDKSIDEATEIGAAKRHGEEILQSPMELTVFYHVAGIGDWRDVVREQLDLARECRLPSLRISYVGEPAGLFWLGEEIGRRKLSAELLRYDSNVMHYETFAMLEIERWVKQHAGAVLYFHTKGVSAPGHEGKRMWRKLMQEHTIYRWRENLASLTDHDAVGVNWREMPPISHFCGNFWMARADYLRTLRDFRDYHASLNHVRTSCEFWIGSSTIVPRILSLVDKDADYCHPSYFG